MDLKIAHICLASAFTEGMAYQENLLTAVHATDGHEVLIVSNCQSFSNAQIVNVAAEDRVLSNGVRLVRLPFDRVGSDFLTQKVKKCTRLAPLLDEFHPDVILYHGVIGWGMFTAANFVRNNPLSKLYIDSHEDRHNSGTNAISLFFQYKILTKFIIHKILSHIEKILYVTPETKDFLIEILAIPDRYLEYYPLGGIVVEDNERLKIRKTIRSNLSIEDDQIVYIHSGKLVEGKRTLELLTAFRNLRSKTARLLIVGSIPDHLKGAIESAISRDRRVQFLGWRNASDLRELMCASDAYLQPGTQSASLQNAICCGLPVLVSPDPSHVPLIDGNGYFVETIEDIEARLQGWCDDPQILKSMRQAALRLARELLDYQKLAARIYR
jgi:glycosyltransferase involved in cell wall biosynthesis